MKFGLMFERDATNSRDTKNSRDARNIRNSHNNIDGSNSPGANNSSNPRKSNDTGNNKTPPKAVMQASAGTRENLQQQYSRIHSSTKDNCNRGGPAIAVVPSSLEIKKMPESFGGNHEKKEKKSNKDRPFFIR